MPCLLESLLVTLTLFNSGLSKCTQLEKAEFIQSNLKPECQNKLDLILGVNSDLTALNPDSVCTSECLGKYENWLLLNCDDAKAAKVVRLSCLKDNTTKAIRRCRYSFPDVTDLEIFHSTQCAALLQNPAGMVSCTIECKQQLDALIDRFGCCFQSVYNNNDSITSLFQEGFLDKIQEGILEQFEMSSLLESCREGNVPNACSGEPFSLAASESSSGTTTYFCSIAYIIFCAICSFLL